MFSNLSTLCHLNIPKYSNLIRFPSLFVEPGIYFAPRRISGGSSCLGMQIRGAVCCWPLRSQKPLLLWQSTLIIPLCSQATISYSFHGWVMGQIAIVESQAIPLVQDCYVLSSMLKLGYTLVHCAALCPMERGTWVCSLFRELCSRSRNGNYVDLRPENGWNFVLRVVLVQGME